jgi:hypothetical protein
MTGNDEIVQNTIPMNKLQCLLQYATISTLQETLSSWFQTKPRVAGPRTI